MRLSHLNSYLLPCLLSCRTILAAAQSGGWVVGWGDNSGGAATGVAPTSPYGPQWNVVGTVAVAGRVLTNIIAISAGDMHSLAINSEGEAFAWGANGTLDGAFDITNGVVMFHGRPLRDIVSMAAGRGGGTGYSLALRRDGHVMGWGDNRSGQTDVPSSLSNVVAIAAGAFQGFALKADGSVAIWGGQGYPSPPQLSNIIAISAAGDFGEDLALTRDGYVLSWWRRAPEHFVSVPAGLSNVVAISTGWGQSLALKRDGTVLGWGNNRTCEATGIPTPLPGSQAAASVMVAGQILSNVVAVAAAHEFSAALKADGRVVTWGTASGVPISPPEGLSNVTAISASGYYCLAITTNRIVAERFRVARVK